MEERVPAADGNGFGKTGHWWFSRVSTSKSVDVAQNSHALGALLLHRAAAWTLLLSRNTHW